MSIFLNILVVLCTFAVLSNACSDSASNCANWVRNGFCKSSYYTYTQKKAQCALSCGYCGSTSTASGSATSSCSDKIATCGYWAANGFCTNGFYNTTIQAQWCANTCGLCSSTSEATTEGSTEATTST
ncbi:unnamed protein product [Caenorhabditis angaria]|uniref:ShKT domain-containing protein n=1 Tax=Caenorhabditis angaria TaxID=860376 RepID=A0A9P1MVS3_9PELO|nr:unnamed protein product [Caenorhabditis angaria]